MAKLTLSFKGRLLSVHHLDQRPLTIGRDPDCRVAVDSLAVAPRHAELISTEAGILLLALDPEYPVLLNNERVDQASLHDGDFIQIGKHTLTFAEDGAETAPQPTAETPPDRVANETGDLVPESVPAYMQAQSGPHIGRVIVFRRAVTRLSRFGAADVIVTRRGNRYHLSRLGGEEPIKIAGEVVEKAEETELHHKDIVEIGGMRLRFFSSEAKIPSDTVD